MLDTFNSSLRARPVTSGGLRTAAKRRRRGGAAARLAKIRSFLNYDRLDLYPHQSQQLSRRLFDELCRRSTYFSLILLVCSGVVCYFGSPAPEPKFGFGLVAWHAGFWALAAVQMLVFWRAINIPPDETQKTLAFLHAGLCAWIVVMSAWWFVGFGALVTWVRPAEGQFVFVLSKQFFLFLTLIAQFLVIVLFAPSRQAMLSAILFGFYVPLRMLVGPGETFPLFEISSVFHLVVYCGIGWILNIGHVRMQKRQLMREAERDRANHFIAAISHDLRQPLATLALKLRSMKGRAENPEMMASIEMLRQQTAAIETMVNGTLDLSRLASGTWSVKSREIALPHLIEKVISDMSADAREKGVVLECDSIPYLVRSDPAALERIVRNLVGNALKYTSALSMSGEAGRVRVTSEVLDEREIVIKVADNGHGIPANRLDDIFGAYIQLDNPERDRSKGLGLGLSIVQGLAALLNHRLAVESKPEKGSTFSIAVPLVGRIPPELLNGPAEAADEVDLSGMTVLVIEDEQGPREALAERLIELGCYVITGETAEEVTAAWKADEWEEAPRFIISDYRLRSGVTGLEAIADVRNTFGEAIPAAIWTGETSPAVLREISRRGFGILAKPPEERAMVALMAKARPRAVEAAS